ncbi:MAG TPA: hypothetical protein VHX88_09635 [Solirubrobacteraceae bacterium]|jgi:hypothetical protein|nr:hypothetical protein [Solirubrobacteraceae bacterium]
MRRLTGVLAALALLLVAPAALAASAADNLNPFNDQGSSPDYRSLITSVVPKPAGLTIAVQQFSDQLLVTNHTGQTVTVYGYQGEPYARLLANGTVQQNVRSPAFYLNRSFYGDITVPASASASDPPKWALVDKTATFLWHDHRIHWLSPSVPPEVKNKRKRTLIFNWKVPISVGATHGDINGQLFWTPNNSKVPVAVIIVGSLIVIAGLGFVVVVQRRRIAAAGAGGGESW